MQRITAFVTLAIALAPGLALAGQGHGNGPKHPNPGRHLALGHGIQAPVPPPLARPQETNGEETVGFPGGVVRNRDLAPPGPPRR